MNELDNIPELVRIHKSYLVSLAYVDNVRHYTVTLADETELPVSRHIYGDVKKSFPINYACLKKVPYPFFYINYKLLSRHLIAAAKLPYRFYMYIAYNDGIFVKCC